MTYSEEIGSFGLTTTPRPDMGKILVTGATGYIGGRLVPELLARGYKVRIMVRSYSPDSLERWPEAEMAVADARDIDSLQDALKGINTAYYLIHSLILGQQRFESVDLLAATNFRIAAENQGVNRIIFLAGLGNKSTKLSPHLRNRIKVAEKLSSGKIPVTVLRSCMIIGSGSASYEILKNLVDNTPVFFIPKWAKTKSQPIAIRDVIKYLVGVLEIEETKGKTYDIGGKDILTYDEKLKVLSKLLGKKRYFYPSLITNTAIYGYIASLLTPVPGPIAKVLVEGCKNEVVCMNNEIKSLIGIDVLSFKEALLRALSREEMDRIATRWSDAYPPAHDLAIKLHELNYSPRYTRSYLVLTHKKPDQIYQSFCKVGGKNGWFHNNWMWRMCGFLDRILMGVGTARGRRSFFSLRINDVIDFWRVENIIQNKTLLLRAEMKVPGMAWLEFHVDKGVGINKFSVNAYFQPDGWWGIVYWYNFLPFHSIIFVNLLKQIEKRATE
ncbi:MAG: SDR family oxidoreductase [Bacteroidales bacterium]|nr:SDR family oxidoreductase [Bacteroidales bacterium]